MPLTNLVFRLVKGSPLSDVEGDGNLSDIQDFVNGLEAIQSVSLNPDGTLKNGTLNSPAQLANIPALADTFSSNETAPAGVLGTNIYAVNNANITAYQKGMQLRFVANAANPGPCSVQVNPGATLPIVALTVVPIFKSVSVPLAANDILAGQVVELLFDGTNFQLVFMAPAVATSTDVLTGTDNQKIVTALALAGTQFVSPAVYVVTGTGIIATVPHGFPVIPHNYRWVLVCQTAEHGFQINDEVPVECFFAGISASSIETWTPQFCYRADATNLTLIQQNGIAPGGGGAVVGGFASFNTSGAITAFSQANWRAKAYASL